MSATEAVLHELPPLPASAAPSSVAIDLLAGTLTARAASRFISPSRARSPSPLLARRSPKRAFRQKFDIVKVRLQSSDAYKGTMDCATRILREEGPTAFYKGTVMPLVGIGACVSLQFAGLQAGKRAFTEGVGYGMYFACYEYLVQREMETKAISRKEIGMGTAALYGAAAGYAMWLTNYPLDVIKSRMQTDGLPSQGALRKYSSPLDCARQLYAENGLKGFIRGLAPTLIRSPFVNASTFVVFELTMRFLT
ncbi:hypothetical protein RQP46_000106 [Phenoliferia psychrophenolica]